MPVRNWTLRIRGDLGSTRHWPSFVSSRTSLRGCVLLALIAGTTGGAKADLTPDLFVTTAGAGSTSVKEYTSSGVYVRDFVTAGSGGLTGAGALQFGPDGNLYVDGATSIREYNGTTGAYIKDVVSLSAGAQDFTQDSSGNFYVAYTNSNQVVEYNSAGSQVRAFTSLLSTPEGVALTTDGNLLVTNAYSGPYRNTVTEINLTTGISSTFATGLGEPIGIALGTDGRYYAANYTAAESYGGTNPDTIQVIGASGGVSSTWNSGGNIHGASYLAIAANELALTSYYNDTIQLFNFSTGASIGSFSVPYAPEGIAFGPTVVPEPNSLILSGIAGLLGLSILRLRRARVDRSGNPSATNRP